MEKLNEIKRGQEGFGILIENEGYINPKDKLNSVISESIESSIAGGDDFHCPYPLVYNAVLQRYGVENANGRIYPESVLKREVDKYQELVKERRALAELNHPSDVVIDLSRVAINVIEMHWEGNTLVGKIEIITSPGFRKYGIISCEGDQTANLLLSGYKIGLSSRGVGTVTTKYGQTIVGDDYSLAGFDVVSDPSTHNAWIVSDGSEGIPTAYLESKEKGDKPVIFEELSRFDSWLND